jgi:predicted TIM-barrel fold metal-dependent hydrolase
MVKLLDTHQHLVYPDVAGYEWTAGIPVLANQAFTVSDYQGLTDGHDVATLFMETGVDDADYQAEARFVAGLAADDSNNIVGMIASCRPEADDGYDAWLDECADMPVVGYRRILHVVDDAMSQDETFRANVRKLGERNLTFDICFLSSQLAVALELARACDNTQLILNHCGVPDIAGGNMDPWKQNISNLASMPNVACKVSGIMAYCAPGTASLDTIRPWLDHVTEAFGPDRLVWGSDWPVVNMANGLVDWLSVTNAYLGTLSGSEAEKLANQNVSRIYKVEI